MATVIITTYTPNISITQSQTTQMPDLSSHLFETKKMKILIEKLASDAIKCWTIEKISKLCNTTAEWRKKRLYSMCVT